MSTLDIAQFKEALGHFATGVVVISAEAGSPVGFTCQTFGSLSLEPALISFAARRESTSWPKIRAAKVIGVSVLDAGQESIARCFATNGADKFDGVGYQSGPQGAPLLDGAIAHLEGSLVDVVSYGDHDIAIVAVHHVASHPGAPLLYFRGGFNVLA